MNVSQGDGFFERGHMNGHHKTWYLGLVVPISSIVGFIDSIYS